MFAGQTNAGADVASAAAPFQLFTSKQLEDDAKALQAKPGNNNLFDAKGLPLQIVMTTETAKSALSLHAVMSQAPPASRVLAWS